ncbi:hypothetical protein [Phenylobacterium sp.]|uniref:hypothetical protein n=1 Tax=Phenylobacterium sp. TaxID=1871053 RepID=UPI00289D5D37|nr:hypothetical protein [Phenylobacterium sp.]
MLFLLNDVVLNLSGAKLSPKMASRRFRALPFNVVSKLGQELYAEDPLLHFDRPERAKRLATLIIAKAPSINAALFVAPAYGCAPDDVAMRYANVDFEVMARLSSRQEQGTLDTVWADRQVWRRLAA